MSQDKKFIITKDESVASQLLEHYKLISKNHDGTYVFENISIKDHFDFSNIKGKVAFSNKLLF